MEWYGAGADQPFMRNEFGVAHDTAHGNFFFYLSKCILSHGWVSHAQENRNLHSCFVSQSWLFQAVVILGALVIWYLFGIYGPGFQAVDFLYFNF